MTFYDALLMKGCGGYDGIGIVLDRSFGLVGYDADACIKGGAISESARKHIAVLSSYTETSSSGTGIHVLVRGELPPGRPKARRSRDVFRPALLRRYGEPRDRHA